MTPQICYLFTISPDCSYTKHDSMTLQTEVKFRASVPRTMQCEGCLTIATALRGSGGVTVVMSKYCNNPCSGPTTLTEPIMEPQCVLREGHHTPGEVDQAVLLCTNPRAACYLADWTLWMAHRFTAKLDGSQVHSQAEYFQTCRRGAHHPVPS